MPYWQRPPWGPFATVTLKSDPEGLAFHRVAGLIVEGWRHHTRVGRVYQPLCAAPCTLGLPPGVMELALSTPGGVPERTAPVTIPSGSSEVYGYFESRLGFRIAGWTITAASLIGGITLMTLAFHDHETCYGYYGCEHIHTVNTGEFVAGMLVLGIGTPIGIFMAAMRDIPHIEVRGPSALLRTPGLTLSGKL